MPFPMLRAALSGAIALFVAMTVSASTTLEAVHDHLGAEAAPAPGVVLVYDFDANPERVQVSLPTLEMLTGGSVTARQRVEAGRRASAGLAHALFESLRRRGAPVQRAVAETPVPERALLVKGRFLSVDEGEGRARGSPDSGSARCASASSSTPTSSSHGPPSCSGRAGSPRRARRRRRA